MITKDIKISRLLKNYPEALNILIETNPHFKKLENKFLRKSLAGRVTVEQAARIAGVDTDLLLERLNKKKSSSQKVINVNSKLPVSKIQIENAESSKPGFLVNIDKQKINILDVRPYIEQRNDPLKIILSKVKELNNDNVLLLINSFEPIPLYSVLKKKGYTHWTEVIDGTYKIYFYKNDINIDEEEKIRKEKSSPVNFNLTGEENIIELDVSQLEPPEPMIKILETVSNIEDNTILLVHHHREPLMLHDKLAERGFRAVTHKIKENAYEVLIFKKENNG